MDGRDTATRRDTGAVLLLLTPVGAVLLGAWTLGERPTAMRRAGCVLILVSAYATVAGRRARPTDGRSGNSP